MNLRYTKFHELVNLDVDQYSMLRRAFDTACTIWDKVFKNGPSEICGRQPLKSLK